MFLYDLIVGPIELLISWVYVFIRNRFALLGVFGAIYGVSLVVNFLTLPIYNVAEGIQNKERLLNKKLEPMIKHIKKTFKGDEQFMMLSEYYRQNNYHPLSALKGSLSILIEIPFFIAAYHYLSAKLPVDKDSWLIFRDFGAPDGLLEFELFGSLVSLNVLPIIMTLINFASAYVYTKDAPTREKVQTYGIGLIFLFLLYNSPSGLVAYWILNNLFSLLKNVIVKTKYARTITLLIVGIHFIAYGAVSKLFRYEFIAWLIPIILGLLIMVLPFVWKHIASFKNRVAKLPGWLSYSLDTKTSYSLVISSGLGLALLCGLLLPSLAIGTSPVEFANLGNTVSPLSYIWSSLFVFLGLFLLWPFALAKMCRKDKVKYFAIVMTILLVFALFNAFVFKSNYGNLDAQFHLDVPDNLKKMNFISYVGPVLVVIISLLLFGLLCCWRKINFIIMFMLSVSLVEIILGIKNIVFINKDYKQASINVSETNQNLSLSPVYHFSKTGKNVVFLFLDRASSIFVPYALEFMPEFNEKLSGFTYYPNTLSFHGMTITGGPAMMGGYEYSLEEMNKRTDQTVVEKHNESLLLAPQLFKDAGYGITVINPPFPDYSRTGEGLSIYNTESLDGIYVEAMLQRYYGRTMRALVREKNIQMDTDIDKDTRENAKSFSMLQVLPPCLRYNFDSKFRVARGNTDNKTQIFLSTYSELYYLNTLTDFEGEGNQFMFIGNETVHEPTWMDENLDMPTSKENSIKTNIESQDEFTVKTYQTFLVTMKRLGMWFDYLKENGVYDNTRIVIVADHGHHNFALDGVEANLEDADNSILFVAPLLMFKDFNSTGDVKRDESFMMNADSIYLLKEGLDEVSNINPFTGNKMVQNKEDGANIYFGWIMNNAHFMENAKTVYHTIELDYNQMWHYKGDDIFDLGNWTKYKEE